MSKLFFRWLRGELNGYYLMNMYDTMNSVTDGVRQFLATFRTMQFDSMDSQTLYNIGKFASVFLPRYSTEEQLGSVVLSESHEVSGVEYSERGLYNTAEDRFDFKHTTQEEGLSDINTLATPSLRSSLVGNEVEEGYIASSDEDVFDSDGNVRQSSVLEDPPSGEAYSDFYGEKFLFLSEGNKVSYAPLNPALYADIYKTLQWIRYNGATLSSLLKITSILCPDGYVKIQSITLDVSGKYFIISYVADPSSAVPNKLQRLYLLDYIIKLKFKQCVLKALT